MDLDYIIRKADAAPLVQRHNAAKEALQQCLLAALARKGLLADVKLVGGTALRLLHRLPRYSEDLDFIAPVASHAQLPKWGATLNRALGRIGVTALVGAKGPTQVDARVRKRGYTIYLAATSPAFASFARDGLQVSFEFDLDPPDHVTSDVRTLMVADEQVTIPTLALPSLMAGKLHILLTRQDREKGRDWYDYLWYRRKGVIPNVAQLQSAIDQTGPGPEACYWMSYLRERARLVNWRNVQEEVGYFLEDKTDARNLNDQTIPQATPYPDFEAMLAEIGRLGPNRAGLKTGSPVLRDVELAAMEGDERALELRSAIAALAKRRKKR